MRFENYINEQDFNVLGFVYLTEELNEVSDNILNKIQSLGKKLGIKVTRSTTFQNHIKDAGKGVVILMKMVIDYSLHADVMDISALKKLKDDMKTQLDKISIEDLMDFLINLDKTFIGITSIPRHVIQNVLGVNITTYHNWVSNRDYIDREMIKVISTLGRMKDDKNVLIAKQLYKNVIGKTI